VIPDNKELRDYVIAHCHDRAYSGHRGFLPTKALVAKNFYWFGLDRDVQAYVKSCDTCQRVKTMTTKPYGLIQPLPIPLRRGGSISLDQIVVLPTTKRGFDAILVVVDRFTKYTHFIPCKTNDTAEKLARLLFERVLCHTGLPDDIVSDRDKRFSTGKFIRELWRLFGTHQSPSTAYHPQSDGQTERMNRVFHEYVRAFISETHKDWDIHLYTAMFALNNSVSDSIGCTPALLTYGFHPRTPHSQEIERMLAGDTASRSPAAYEFVETMDRNFIIAKRCLQRAQDKMRAAREGKSQELVLIPGQMVLLKTTNLTMPGKSKFLPRFVGPFKVLRPIGVNAFQLELPPSWKIHNVFNCSLLRVYEARPGFTPRPARPPEDDYAYVPEKIMAHELLNPGTPTGGEHDHYKYKVHYRDTPHEEDTWEYGEELHKHCFELLKKYHCAHDLHALTEPISPVPRQGSVMVVQGERKRAAALTRSQGL
jgi:hypothetical protein